MKKLTKAKINITSIFILSIFICGCCELTIYPAMVVVDFDQFSQTEISKISFKTKIQDSIFLDFDNDLKRINSKIELNLFAFSKSNLYIFQNDTLILDTISNLEIDVVSEKDGCPGRTVYGSEFIHKQTKFNLAETHEIHIRK